VTALVAVLIDAEADDARTPHDGRFTGHISQQDTQLPGVNLATRVWNTGKDGLDIGAPSASSSVAWPSRHRLYQLRHVRVVPAAESLICR
jgi:hypothetical protein